MDCSETLVRLLCINLEFFTMFSICVLARLRRLAMTEMGAELTLGSRPLPALPNKAVLCFPEAQITHTPSPPAGS